MLSPFRTSASVLIFGVVFSFVLGTRGYVSYANDWVDPDVILARAWNSSASAAEQTVIRWAKELASLGPWSVMDKAVTPPSGDKHDYLSWAPYTWPNCSNLKNKTALPLEVVWKQCAYEYRDGQFNPDRLLVNDTAAFAALADAVLYNSIAWVITDKTDVYSKTAASFVARWFINPATRMNPNVKYGQLNRGPGGQTGLPYGILDLHGMTKIVSAIEILRKGKSPHWTTAMDKSMKSWATAYIVWLETAPIAIQERETTNNHGTYYYNQLASLKILIGDLKGASKATDRYFATLFKEQVNAKGNQPLEASRTRPFHYMAYNLASIVTNARLAKFAAPSSDPWKFKAAGSATIKTAVDYMMSLPAPPIDEARDAKTAVEVRGHKEISLAMARTAQAHGNHGARYTNFLTMIEPDYAAQPWFLWTQPLWNGKIATVVPSTVSDTSPTVASGTNASASNSSAAPQTSGNSASKVTQISIWSLVWALMGFFQ